MAGGKSWFLDRKSDGDHAYTIGTGAQTQHWRRLEIMFQISKDVPASEVDLGRGQRGEVSQVMVCIVGTEKESTRKAPDEGVFMCMEDQSDTQERPTGFFKRTQIWKFIGPDEQYDPATGQAIES